MLGLALVANEFVTLVLGREWIHCIPLLEVLCIAGAFMPFYTVFQNLAIGCRRSDMYLWCNIGLIIAQISIILLCYYYFSQSIIVVVSVYSAFMVIWLAVWQATAKRLINLKWLDAILDIVPFLIITVAVFTLTYFATFWISNKIVLLIAKVIIGALLYIVVMKFAKVRIFDECWEFLRKKIGKN